MDLQPMATSDRAWVWAGHNFVEDELKLEKLAVRFKYEDTAKEFFESVQDCIKELLKAGLPSTLQQYHEALSSDSEQQDANDYDDDDYNVDFDER